MRTAVMLAVLALAACENPRLGIGASVGAGGLSTSTTISGNVGGASVAVSG